MVKWSTSYYKSTIGRIALSDRQTYNDQGAISFFAQSINGVDWNPYDNEERHEPADSIRPLRVEVVAVPSRCVVDPIEYQQKLLAANKQHVINSEHSRTGSF